MSWRTFLVFLGIRPSFRLSRVLSRIDAAEVFEAERAASGAGVAEQAFTARRRFIEAEDYPAVKTVVEKAAAEVAREYLLLGLESSLPA